MSKSKIKQAAVVVSERLRSDESVSLDEAIIAPYGGVVEYVQAMAEAALRRDEAAFKRDARNAIRNGGSIQLELPGLGHASLPFVVFARDADTGEEFAVPTSLATFAQIKAEIRLARRSVNTQERVVSAYEATIERLEELGVDDSQTGAEIEAIFPAELDA